MFVNLRKQLDVGVYPIFTEVHLIVKLISFLLLLLSMLFLPSIWLSSIVATLMCILSLQLPSKEAKHNFLFERVIPVVMLLSMMGYAFGDSYSVFMYLLGILGLMLYARIIVVTTTTRMLLHSLQMIFGAQLGMHVFWLIAKTDKNELRMEEKTLNQRFTDVDDQQTFNLSFSTKLWEKKKRALVTKYTGGQFKTTKTMIGADVIVIMIHIVFMLIWINGGA